MADGREVALDNALKQIEKDFGKEIGRAHV